MWNRQVVVHQRDDIRSQHITCITVSYVHTVREAKVGIIVDEMHMRMFRHRFQPLIRAIAGMIVHHDDVHLIRCLGQGKNRINAMPGLFICQIMQHHKANSHQDCITLLLGRSFVVISLHSALINRTFNTSSRMTSGGAMPANRPSYALHANTMTCVSRPSSSTPYLYCLCPHAPAPAYRHTTGGILPAGK